MTAWVRVQRSDGGGIGQDFYVAGNFQQPAGRIGTPALSETGTVRFETLDGNGDPDWRARVEVDETPGNSQAHPQIVTLQPLSTV
jgi:hypothetical protein